MKILINGGTGFIGSRLCNHFIASGMQVSILTRNIHQENIPPSVMLIDNLNDSNTSYDVIINLAGEALDKNRWNEQVKKIIYQSRILSTQKVIEYIKATRVKPKVLITGSAIGFYGNSLTEKFDEDTPPADNSFIHLICADWEGAGLKALEYGVRVCVIRTGIVLDKYQGALAKMLTPFKFGLGAQLGDGKQWMSWIHIEDVVAAVDFLVQNEALSGVFNLTAPGAVTNAEFTKKLAQSLHRKAFLRFPKWMVQIVFGELGDALILQGQQVIPSNLTKVGYKFKFPMLETALKDIMEH